MKLAFILTMPGNNAWNGKWNGEGKLYARVIEVGTTKKAADKHAPLLEKSFGYNFGDGWFARVSVRAVDAREARKLTAASAGFCGYDWMIDQIREHGRILPLSEQGAEVST